MRRLVVGFCFLAVLFGAHPWVCAKTNALLWQQEPYYAQTEPERVLARSQFLSLSLQTEPYLTWQQIGETRQVAMAAALVLIGQRQLEMPRLGYSLRLDALSLNWRASSAPDADADAPLTHAGGVGLGTAQIEARHYPWGLVHPYFLGVTLGTYGAISQWQGTGSQSSATHAWPVSVGVGGGAGRIWPINPRIALGHIEQMLQAAAVIDKPLPEPVRQEILALWLIQGSALGVDKQALGVMRALDKASLLRAPLAPAVAYRLERILETWVTQPIMLRYHGTQAWALFRGHYGPSALGASPWGMSIELRAQRIYNLGLLSALSFEPAFAIGVRRQDQASTTLVAPVRPTLFDSKPLPTLLHAERMSLDIPALYTRLLIDADANPSGVLSLNADVALGYTTQLNASAAAGGAFTFLLNGVRGIKVGLAVAGGRTLSGGEGIIELQLAYVDGSGSTFYVAPQYPNSAQTAQDVRGVP